MTAERRPRVFVARRIPEAGLAPLREATELSVWEAPLPPPRDALLAAVAGCAGILTLLTDRVDAELLDAAGPDLRVVSNYAVGVDNIDLAECTRRGIPVGHTPGVLTETTADLAFALLMAAARRIVEAVDFVRAGRWQTWDPMLLLGADVHGATLGLVGFGRIGQAVARRAAGFGMTVLYHSRRRADPAVEAALGATWVPLDELFERSDFVSLHVPLTAETRRLVDADRLRRMKPTAILVNTARGPIVDTDALVEALRAGSIGGAALDVTDPEPLPPDHPLLRLPNAIVVPHIGSASRATRARMAEMAAANLLAGLRGDPLPYCANPEVNRRRSAR
ncbi:MAG: D-glycerate dehydrogenase [Chloroflexota bacterium]|nr:MAG: D-glycerate dehydrogenase [Chloroflexota bacterium]